MYAILSGETELQLGVGASSLSCEHLVRDHEGYKLKLL